jgi:hypothetical protein
MKIGQTQLVGQILHAYIAIHNDIFGGGTLRALRRLIPIPGFFQAIDFEGHSQTLATIALQLEAVRIEIREESTDVSFTLPLASYTDALLNTVRKLAHICKNLARRATVPEAYAEQQYHADLLAYEQFVAEYRALGDSLNRAIRAPLS